MADMNAWNKLQQDRGAVKALEALRAAVADTYFFSDEEDEARLVRTIDEHITTYK